MGTLRKALLWSAMERFGYQGTGVLLGIISGTPSVSPRIRPHRHVGDFLQCRQSLCRFRAHRGAVQRPANSADDEATVFYLNIGAGTILTIIICAISPLVAGFYGQPVLIPLLCVLSLQVLLSSFGIVQFALLARAMNFRPQAIVGMLSLTLSGLVGIGMAWRGLGVWSQWGSW